MNPLHRLRAMVAECHARFLNKEIDAILVQALDPVYLGQWVTLLRELDLALTGKTENRREDSDRRGAKEALEGGIWLVYLSDGGYSRLVIDPFDNRFLIDRGLSLQPAIARWDRMDAEA